MNPARRLAPLLHGCLLVVALFPSPLLTAAESRPAKIKRLDSAHTIPDDATWQRLAARTETAEFARTEAVKFLVDLESRRRVWFTDTERYPYHFYFARDRLSNLGNPVKEHDLFNQFEYQDPHRRFEMGTIVHYLDSDLWTVELASSDTLAGDRILHLFETLRDALWIGDKLRFHPMSDLQEKNIAGVRERLPLATTAEVFAGVRYQPLTLGRSFGYLRIVRGPLDTGSVRADQILVLQQLPEEIPVNAGVISAELQAPLGHIAILCANRGTPNMGLLGAAARPDWQALDGQLVELTIGPQEFSLRAADPAKAQEYWRARRPKKIRVPALDAAETRLVEVNALRLKDTRFAGAKASQLGEAARLKGITTPGGFVIPVAYYLAQIRASGALDGLVERLADPAFTTDAGVRGRWLADVRATIEKHPVDPALVSQVAARIRATAPNSRWILRSSTNAEDLAGFTGAGLYRSIRIKAGASEEEIANTIREVWASVWLQGAFEERTWHGVDHAGVAMAILVQPFVDGAVANGVAITANPFAEERPGFLINAQALGGSVTGAGGNEIPEQHMIYTFTGDFEFEVLSRSSRTNGQPLLTEADLKALAIALQKLHDHFLPRWPGPANAVDVEFLVAGPDRHVVILQARPYTVSYKRLKVE
ncbi:MAG TPA: PEP/pyruvate-binding domain-containing protein [Lacunisphaera sp.]|nr:PEP/pyruvate-binding domain-containing protein [Lacunisphaera sp.]